MHFFVRQTDTEWRAARIADPLDRLRYLRSTAANPRIAVQRPFAVIGIMGVLMGLASGFTMLRGKQLSARSAVVPIPIEVRKPEQILEKVWLVDRSSDAELYSNGLRIENRYATSNRTRGAYRIWERKPAGALERRLRNAPSGIVYHTTESELAPFEEHATRTLRRIGAGVLSFVQHNRSYHFVIDRFGGVFRIVQESDVAFHAGHSVWADDEYVYVNLNSAFLGIAFETQTERNQAASLATPAQINSARLLTELLRSRYAIAAADCVTHAQVSVNPGNMRIGYHTDWADKFPFADVGLKDNYAAPPAALSLFGFEYDPDYLQSTGARLVPGLLLAQEQLSARAARLNLPVPEYRAVLRKQYKEIIASHEQD